MSQNPRMSLPPGALRKRKEREREKEAFLYPAAPLTTTTKAVGIEPVSSNRLLAGYMAYEFLTQGTLLGQKFDPARAEAVPLAISSSSSQLAESRKAKPIEGRSAGAVIEPQTKSLRKKEHHSYNEVASILKSDGAHIPGIVNPTQLSRWIQM